MSNNQQDINTITLVALPGDEHKDRWVGGRNPDVEDISNRVREAVYHQGS